MLTAKFMILLLLCLHTVRLGESGHFLRMTFRRRLADDATLTISSWWVLVPLWLWWGAAASSVAWLP